MSDSAIPGEFSPVPTRALWNWNTPIGEAPSVNSYPPNGAPTKSGVLPSDLANFMGTPIQTFSNPPVPFSDATIIGWLRYAEDEIETDTNIRLCQTWIASPPTKSKYATEAVNLITKYQYQQLGVDYDYADAPYDFFFARAQDEGWLYQRLRWRPVKSVEIVNPVGSYDAENITGVKNISFIYPLLNEFFRMPISWIVEDQNRGYVRGVPSTNVQMLPLFAMQLAFMGFAESVPGGLYYQYTAGLTAVDYQTNWSFMKQLVLAKASIRAFRAMQLSVNLGALETQTVADGLSYRVKYSEKGPFWGQIQEAQQEVALLTKRAKMLGGGVFIGTL